MSAFVKLVNTIRANTTAAEVDFSAELLTSIAASDDTALEALCAINAFHVGESGYSPVRQGGVEAGGDVFVHPLEVPWLLTGLLQRTHAFWPRCREPVDDLYVASFAMAGLLKIHPFAGGNGRTSFDFARLLLMWRWQLTTPPYGRDDRIHRSLGALTASLAMTASCGEGLARVRDEISRFLLDATLDSLREHESLQNLVSMLIFSIIKNQEPTCDRCHELTGVCHDENPRDECVEEPGLRSCGRRDAHTRRGR